jgi:hypothetical protein
MLHPKLDTPQGISRQKRNIRRSARLLQDEVKIPTHGDNFSFVQFGGLVDLKLWRKRANRKIEKV